ncbi:hypothetical protein HN371_14730 [Candidatus Poribacteria bacterium]|mgnify:CR=1 FL=1|jgi:hypothetical protein|nr:hypothetical protein [Candidatus Poribacteria bacterium]MBT5709550.1 hypothetical protein [Candidatus Poribacteria bacterium]MBT7806989.1 hypothetical protein [Candidatus Poribacteria bacterium]
MRPDAQSQRVADPQQRQVDVPPWPFSVSARAKHAHAMRTVLGAPVAAMTYSATTASVATLRATRRVDILVEPYGADGGGVCPQYSLGPQDHHYLRTDPSRKSAYQRG